eukprot:scaffold21701_cov40-Phaeocystis_antarctica.AAC.1
MVGICSYLPRRMVRAWCGLRGRAPGKAHSCGPPKGGRTGPSTTRRRPGGGVETDTHGVQACGLAPGRGLGDGHAVPKRVDWRRAGGWETDTRCPACGTGGPGQGPLVPPQGTALARLAPRCPACVDWRPRERLHRDYWHDYWHD